MTPLRDARILKKEAVAQAHTTVLPGLAVAQDLKKRLAREVVDAHLLARRLLDDARGEAAAILAHAHESAEQVAASAAEEARKEEHTKLASLYLALRIEDERRQERDLDRAISLARVWPSASSAKHSKPIRRASSRSRDRPSWRREARRGPPSRLPLSTRTPFVTTL